MRIIITGVPGTGKTTVSEMLGEKLGLPVVHLDAAFLKKHGLSRGRSSRTGALVADVSRLAGFLKKNLPKDCVVEGHLACEFSIPLARVLVLRCEPGELGKRMQRKKYSAQKVFENLQCEALDYCSLVAAENYGAERVFDVDTTGKSLARIVGKCIAVIRKKSRGDAVDFSGWIYERS